MNLQLTALADRLRSSLFWVPVLFVLGGIVLGQIGIYVDSRIDPADTLGNLPLGLGSTVDSARAVLSTIAGATISFAGVAFSVSLLVIQLASSQYSPRVVHGLFRDPFNKRVMGVVVGTFTYCLVVLRSVRGPLEESGDPVIPNISVGVAVLLGLVAILSIVAFINHSAHSMDASTLLHQVTGDAVAAVRAGWVERDPDAEAGDRMSVPDEEGHAVTFSTDGWVQQVDQDALVALVGEGDVLRVDTIPGRYAIRGTPLCTIWPPPDDPEGFASAVRAAVQIGQTRTMQQDITLGVRQLADVALKALSPGINDPTTAQDALFHLGTVLRALLTRRMPDRRLEGPDGGVVLLAEGQTHDDLVGLAFDEIRLAAAGQPTVCIYLLEVLHLLDEALQRARVTGASEAVRGQAVLVLAASDAQPLLAHDHDRVAHAYATRFGDVDAVRAEHGGAEPVRGG